MNEIVTTETVESTPAVDATVVELAQVEGEVRTEVAQIEADAAVAIAEAQTEAVIAATEENDRWRAVETRVDSLSNEMASRMQGMETTLSLIQAQLTPEPPQSPSEPPQEESVVETPASPEEPTSHPESPQEPAPPRRKPVRWI